MIQKDEAPPQRKSRSQASLISISNSELVMISLTCSVYRQDAPDHPILYTRCHIFLSYSDSISSSVIASQHFIMSTYSSYKHTIYQQSTEGSTDVACLARYYPCFTTSLLAGLTLYTRHLRPDNGPGQQVQMKGVGQRPAYWKRKWSFGEARDRTPKSWMLAWYCSLGHGMGPWVLWKASRRIHNDTRFGRMFSIGSMESIQCGASF